MSHCNGYPNKLIPFEGKYTSRRFPATTTKTMRRYFIWIDEAHLPHLEHTWKAAHTESRLLGIHATCVCVSDELVPLRVTL